MKIAACPYHGWKFDVEGKCLDIPSEPEDSVVSLEAEASGLYL